MEQGTRERQRLAIRAVSAVLLATLALVAFTSCTTTGQPITAAPHFTLAYRGTDGLLHVRWSSDGQTWNDPTSFPPAPALDRGPGLGGIPTGLSQLLVFNRGTILFRMSAIGASEYGSSPPEVLQTGVTVDSPLSVAFTGSGNWLITHRTGGNGVLRLWDGTSTPSAVITPPGALADLCPGDNLSGNLGPKALALNSRVLVAFCQRDSSGNESLQLLPGTIGANGTPSFAAQVPFTLTRPGFDPPLAKIFALAHDGTNFLLATVAPNSQQPGPLTVFGLLIFSSPDGQNWSPLTVTASNTGLNQSARSTPLGIAAIPPRNANPALIQVAQYAGSAQSPRLWEFNGTNWVDRSSAGAFSASPDVTTGFTFRVNGRP
jgi:hypothetical protein